MNLVIQTLLTAILFVGLAAGSAIAAGPADVVVSVPLMVL